MDGAEATGVTEASEPCGAVKMLTYSEVAAQLGISVRGVYRLVREGKLTPHKYGEQRNAPVRISQADVYVYVEATRAPQVPNDDTAGSMDVNEGGE